MKALVTAASRHGATVEVAERIATVLARHGIEARLAPVDDVEDIDAYDAAVIGSAVYVGRWLEPARRLVERNAETLAARPTWLFSSGPLGDPLRPDEDEAVDVDELVAATGAREHRLFAGKLDRSRLGFGERAIVRAVRAPEGDFRDWDAVEAWATEIAAALAPDR